MSGFGVIFLEHYRGFSANIVAGHFGFVFEPMSDSITYFRRGDLGLSFGRVHAETGSDNAGMELVGVKGFGWSLTLALNDVRYEAHAKNLHL